MNLDSLIFSVTYENYQKNILKDKENKTLGQWKLSDKIVEQLKYAYVYLKDSNGMIVKKYTIEKFEKSNLSKGYDNSEKYCFIFKDSKDLFFQYPHDPVQARHYRSSVELDQLPNLMDSEIQSRLNQSKLKRSDASFTKKTTGVFEPIKEQLVKIRNEKFSDKKMPSAEIARKIITRVEEGEDADAVLTEYYLENAQ